MRTIDALLAFQVELRFRVNHAVEAGLRSESSPHWPVLRGEGCAICAWIHGPGRQRFGLDEDFHELCVAHAGFHGAAARLDLLARRQGPVVRSHRESREVISHSLRTIAALWGVRTGLAFPMEERAP